MGRSSDQDVNAASHPLCIKFILQNRCVQCSSAIIVILKTRCVLFHRVTLGMGNCYHVEDKLHNTNQVNGAQNV